MSAPCIPYPDEASYKTVGLGLCSTCGSGYCWLDYLRWESRLNIGLNARDYHLVALVDERDEARRLLAEAARREDLRKCDYEETCNMYRLQRDQLAAELARIHPLIADFVRTVSAARRNMDRQPGGQHVSFHGDFCNTNPSAMSRLVWWAREMEKALSPATKTGGDK